MTAVSFLLSFFITVHFSFGLLGARFRYLGRVWGFSCQYHTRMGTSLSGHFAVTTLPVNWPDCSAFCVRVTGISFFV